MGKIIFTLIAVILLAGPVFAAQTNDEEAIWSQNVITAYKSIQEQHAATMRAVQQAREEVEASAKRQNDALEARLKQLEQTVVQSAASQRERDEINLANSHRFTLKAVAWCVAAGLL